MGKPESTEPAAHCGGADPVIRKERTDDAAVNAKSSPEIIRPDQIGWVGEIDGNWTLNISATPTRVTVKKFRGAAFVDIRKCFRTDEGAIQPTRKGVCLNSREFARLCEQLEEVRTQVAAAQARR
eukprot:gnl/Chilomastix_cuspidata/4488.p2 GENE.gnl/Chilomastix_cuspidata/4488~~gnl/Chilomastix_cuspidata/4488.p2  ORF type:complete len:125 (+),score=40.27 gnl/Chilomastix_cuspidata/4488:38-412(+)